MPARRLALLALTVAGALSAIPIERLVAGAPAHAQGVSFGSPGRVPRTHDTDIGSSTTGDPRLDFVLHCQGCHQAEGTGLDGAVPELRGNVARFAALPGGREYLARVPGVAQSQLDDAAVAALLNWMLAHFDPAHLPADFRPFTREEVAPLRRQPLVEATKVRTELLRAGGY
jgi:mono/diheme cytochrome c family protein